MARSSAPVVPVLSRARGALAARAGAVWRRDRAQLGRGRALANRLARVAVMVVRGVVVHRIGLLAAALTYFTVFSIVPVLVVVLWILRAMDYLPAIQRGLLDKIPIPTAGNEVLHGTLEKIFEVVNRTSQLTSGVVGLAALLFAVAKMFSYTERALHVIAGSEQRAPKLSRMIGYVALLLLPLVVLLISALFVAVLSGQLGRWLTRLLGSVPGLELVVVGLLGLGLLWLGATIFYASAARARIPFSSAAVGGAAAAVALPVVFWVFTGLEVGAAGASGSGLLGVPVFLLWVFTSWWALLVGAEIAVAHRADRVLVHGVSTFRLDAVGERQAAAAIMVRATHAARTSNGAGPAVREDELARELRLPPALVRAISARLVDAGLLAEDKRGLTLRCDPDRTTLAAVIDAVERDPALEPARREAHASLAAVGPTPGGPDPTLRQLADEPVSSPAPR